MKITSVSRCLRLLACAGLLLTACGADPTPTLITAGPAGGAATMVPPTGTVGGGAPAATLAATPAAMPPTLAPATGLKIAHFNAGSEPPTTDPQKISSIPEVGWGALAFEGLMELDESLKPVPAAAETLAISPDGRQYTLTLREGLTYADGVPLTAANYAYAFRRLFDPRIPGRDYASIAYDIAGAQELSEFSALTDTVKLQQLQAALGVATPDSRHIVFTLKAPAAYFPYILAIWVGWPSRQDLVEKGGETWTEPATYIGNGPYVLRAWNHNNSAVWEANPHYRKGRPRIDRLEARIIPDAAVAFAAYKSGELDWIQAQPGDLKVIAADPALAKEHLRVAGSSTYFLGFNTRRPPFDNRQLRQAVAQALDLADFVAVPWEGAAQVPTSFIPPGRLGYEPDVRQPGFDPAAAVAGLAAAGYPHGQGLPRLTLAYPTTGQEKLHAEWVQNQFKLHLGLDLILEPVETSEFNSLVINPDTVPQMFLYGWFQDYPDAQDWLSIVFRSDSAVDVFGWKNAEFDRLTRQADGTGDAEQRRALYKQAQTILVQEVPAVFLAWPVADVLIQPTVSGMREHVTPDDALLAVPGLKNITNIDIQK